MKIPLFSKNINYSRSTELNGMFLQQLFSCMEIILLYGKRL